MWNRWREGRLGTEIQVFQFRIFNVELVGGGGEVRDGISSISTLSSILASQCTEY
jgi:hypothetical protein